MVLKILSDFVDQSIAVHYWRHEIIEEIIMDENILDEILVFSFAKSSNDDYSQKLELDIEIAGIFKKMIHSANWNQMKMFLKKENGSTTNLTRFLELIFGLLETNNSKSLEISLEVLKTIFESLKLSRDFDTKKQILSFKNGFFAQKIGDLQKNKHHILSKMVCFSFFFVKIAKKKCLFDSKKAKMLLPNFSD